MRIQTKIVLAKTALVASLATTLVGEGSLSYALLRQENAREIYTLTDYLRKKLGPYAYGGTLAVVAGGYLILASSDMVSSLRRLKRTTKVKVNDQWA